MCVSELIRRYKEKIKECNCLQDQLRDVLSREVALEQGMVGLRAEVNTLVEETSRLRDSVQANQLERHALEARTTNGEVSTCLMLD